MFEAQSLIEARERASRIGLGGGLQCTAYALSDSTPAIPNSKMGRMLTVQEFGQLQAKLTPKKPAAAAVRRESRKRSAAT